jgi:capsular exopolysaccharide synthesis family protein
MRIERANTSMHALRLPDDATDFPPNQPAVADDYVTFGQVAGLLRRRWALVLITTLACAALALLYAAKATRVYESSALILIDKDQYNLPEMVTHHATEESDLSTEIEMLRSMRLSDDVAHDLALNVSVAGMPRSAVLAGVASLDSARQDKIVLDRDSNGTFTGVSAATGQRRSGIVPGQQVAVGAVAFTLLPAASAHKHLELVQVPQQVAAAALQGALRVGRGDRNANVIWVRYRSADPLLASAVPGALADRYVSSRTAGTKAKVATAIAFLQDQADTLQHQLQSADMALHDFRQQAGVVSLNDEAATSVRETGTLRADRTRLDAERSALQQLVNQSDTSASTYRRLTAFPTLIGNPMVANLLHSLDDLEGQRTELLLRRTQKDPDVQALNRRIGEADNQLRGITQTYLAGLTQQVHSLDQALGAQAQAAATLPGKNMQEDELTRKPKVLNDVYTLVETRLQDARIAESAANPGVSIIDRPNAPTTPVWPRRGLLLAVGCCVGLLAGFGLAWLRDGNDRAIHSRADVTRAVELPVLGVIPHIRYFSTWNGEKDSVLLSGAPPAARLTPGGRSQSVAEISTDELTSVGAVLEAYTWLETSLTFTGLEQEPRTLAFTSAMAGEGKTITAANMAIATAGHGRRVLVIDADLRRGRLHKAFGIAVGPGLADVLAGKVPIHDAIVGVPVGGDVIVDVLPRGRQPAHPTAMLKVPTLPTLIRAMHTRYDLVILDSPPVNLVSDALLIGKLVDGVIVVARAGVTDAAALAEAVRHLRGANAPLLGVLLNDIDMQRDSSYDDSYRYLHQAGVYATADES